MLNDGCKVYGVLCITLYNTMQVRRQQTVVGAPIIIVLIILTLGLMCYVKRIIVGIVN